MGGGGSFELEEGHKGGRRLDRRLEKFGKSRDWSCSSRESGVAWRWFWARVGWPELGLHLGGPALHSRRRMEEIDGATVARREESG